MNIPNQLILMTDEHTRKVLGCYGNKIVQTPNLDQLAKRGTRFTNAYTNVPICVPARASFATGQYAHTTCHWDNATPYFGEPASWGTHLQAAGISVGSIGKLHYRNAEDPVGLDFQEIPMHVVNGVGDVLGCVREPLPKRWKARSLAENIGPGETNYNAYDRQICDESVSWLRENGTAKAPWVLFISMVAPHFPLIAPEAYYSLYEKIGMMPQKPRPNDEHPWFTAMRDCQITDNFTPDKTRIALASYYALVSFVDDLIGKILNELHDLGLTNNTQITYLSDHGDNIGERDLWGKSNFYEESVGIPCIIAGPSIPENKVCDTPISLIDIHPTILTTAGLKPDPSKPGKSISDIANEKADTDRVIFSEYHAMGAVSGAFMIRQGRWKYIHYLGMKPQLFDLETDPDELSDLGTSQQHKSVCERMEGILCSICTPEEIDKAARTAQREIIDAHGGIDAVVQKGGFGATPPPGSKPKFA
jgi:choline-sulfatase